MPKYTVRGAISCTHCVEAREQHQNEMVLTTTGVAGVCTKHGCFFHVTPAQLAQVLASGIQASPDPRTPDGVVPGSQRPEDAS